MNDKKEWKDCWFMLKVLIASFVLLVKVKFYNMLSKITGKDYEYISGKFLNVSLSIGEKEFIYEKNN